MSRRDDVAAQDRKLVECECCGETFPTMREAEAHAGWPDYCGCTPTELVEVEA